MFNFICSTWKKVKNKFNKIVPIIFTFIFIFSPLSVSAANNNFSNFYNQVFPYNLTAALYLNGGRVLEDSFDNENRFYEFYNFSTSPVTTISLHNRIIPDGWDITFLFAEYDYYLAFTCIGDAGQIENFTYFPNRLAIQNHSTSHDGSTLTLDCINTVFYHHDTANEFGFTAIGKVPELPNNFIFSVNTYGSSGTVPKDLRTSITVFQVPKSDNSSDTSAIISAIQNQTDKIVYGDSSTGGIVSGADSSKTELESIVAEYQQIENSMLDNFTLYQSDILSDVTGWSWGGLSTCANWVGDTLTSYFQNMGDFKQYIIYPLLLGIALFFIGRGSAIIGHLYRKPTVTTTISNRESVTYKQNGTKYTDSKTTTYRDGGVLRK